LYEMGYFPESWTEGHIIPIFKKGDRNDVSNYRGITLLSIVGKLFTRILNNRLIDWAEEYNIYVEAQAGFRKNMGTTDNIFILNNLITHCINSNERLYCAFVDFTKAFDFVVRDILWFKLLKLGIRGKMLDIIKSIYSSVNSRVKQNNTLSEPFECNIGVRQGECLSPFLFAMYVNDLEAELIVKGISGINVGLINLHILLYADDIVLFGKTPEELQDALTVLEHYCKRWKLKVNTDKTKIMVFRKGGRLPNNLDFIYDDVNLEIVNKFCYLGVVFTTGGSSFETQKTLSGQALKAVFSLNKFLYNFTALTPSHVLELFDKLVSPILNFGSEVWGFYKSPSIETVHLQFCKKLLGVKQSTQNDFIYGELGRISYQSQRYLNIIKYWFKVVTSVDNKYIKHIYNLMLADLDAHPLKSNWASSVKELLCRLGFGEVWDYQGVGNISAFLKQFKQRVRDIFVQEWHSRLETSSRARCYITFSNFQYKTYLSELKINKYRKSLSRLRLSSHRLEVEVGRWVKPNKVPYENRKCKVCGILEDEFHFLLECPLYTDLRRLYINRYFWNRPNMPKFIELLTAENTNLLKKLSTYIEKAFNLRKNIVLA
ncbi:MAG: reverse transcriptase family protein, partial [Candidatus Thiodiazotropha endolucinida]|nr:reverse transcriptase family protein [Candidatus Thiodiazotropha taylori]MCW4343939.1 reverse transcriptase family protein [Candidatus Thiodiazotropha endolucinida]